MSNSKIRIAIITNVIPSYRKGFYDRIFEINNFEISVFCQSHIPGNNIENIAKDYPNNVIFLNFISLNNEYFVWQFLPWKRLCNDFDLIFIPGNPRVFSDVIFSLYCLFLKKKLVLWTIGRSYKGSFFSEKIRFFWSRMFQHIFVYNNKDIEYLRNNNFKESNIVSMNNGLDQKFINNVVLNLSDAELNAWKSNHSLNNKFVFISSSRLTKKNNFELVIKALSIILNKGANFHWILVGDGPEEGKLKKMAKKLNLLDHITFAGRIFDENELAFYFLSSNVSVLPGAIGLSILHSFGYGIPVVCHNNPLFHGPEYVVFDNFKTGLNFKRNNHLDLADKLFFLYNNQEVITVMSQNCFKIANQEYNVDVMKSNFEKIVSQILVN
jgi:glycosyltransferase involved in cell wall biosynthesis